jgi:hypothetical protein
MLRQGKDKKESVRLRKAGQDESSLASAEAKLTRALNRTTPSLSPCLSMVTTLLVPPRLRSIRFDAIRVMYKLLLQDA